MENRGKKKSADAVCLSPPENVFMNMELKIAKKRCKKQGLRRENQLTSRGENATIYELSACCGKVCLFGALFCRH